MAGLKQFRNLPRNLMEWSRWMRDQDLEPGLGNPSSSGQVLKSTADGERSWQDLSLLNFGPASLNLPTYTTTELADIDNAVNSGGNKQAGQAVFNTTTSKPVYAAGENDNDVWVDATGATAHTPS